MTTPHRTLQMALDALTNCLSEHGHRCNRCDSEIDEGGKLSAALREALAADHLRDGAEKVAPAAPVVPTEDFCYCNEEISLQIVSGGAAPEGLYGRVTLRIDGKYVDYVRATPAQPAVPLTEGRITGIANELAFGGGHCNVYELARAIEAAHGITGGKP